MEETLEEIANEYSKKRYSPEQGFPEEDYYISFLSFRAGAKWQQQRSYSEEDMKDAYIQGTLGLEYKKSFNESFYKWFEQFKKK